MFRSIGVPVTVAALMCVTTSVADAVDPAIKCQTGKLKESAKYAACRLKAEAKAVQSG